MGSCGDERKMCLISMNAKGTQNQTFPPPFDLRGCGQLLGSNVKAQCIMGVCLDSFMAVSKNTSFNLSLPFSCHKYPPQLHHAAISIQQTTELTWVRNV